MPTVSAPSGLGWDKLNHAVAIAAATGLAYLTIQQHRRATTASFLYGTFLGILIEILQGVMKVGRSAEWGDCAADLVGAGCVWVVIRIYRRNAAAQR